MENSIFSIQINGKCIFLGWHHTQSNIHNTMKFILAYLKTLKCSYGEKILHYIWHLQHVDSLHISKIQTPTRNISAKNNYSCSKIFQDYCRMYRVKKSTQVFFKFMMNASNKYPKVMNAVPNQLQNIHHWLFCWL